MTSIYPNAFMQGTDISKYILKLEMKNGSHGNTFARFYETTNNKRFQWYIHAVNISQGSVKNCGRKKL